MNWISVASCLCFIIILIVCVILVIIGWQRIRAWFDNIVKPIPLPLQCPKGTTLRGLICYENCPENYTSDGTIGCYENCPRDWKGTQTITHCQKHRVYSPVGTVDTIPQCADNLVNFAGLCYDVPPGWHVTAPGVIARKCPAGTNDSGTTCWYGRGAGYGWQFGDPFNLENARKRCESDHGAGNCELHGLIYYPKCRQGFTPFGCCICHFSKEVRSQIGTLPTKCPANKELHGRLCYNKCPEGYQRPWYDIEYCSSVCPAGTIDIGIGGCQRKRIDVTGRALTEVGICPDGYERKGILCYKK
jgi:hypothetical protein